MNPGSKEAGAARCVRDVDGGGRAFMRRLHRKYFLGDALERREEAGPILRFLHAADERQRARRLVLDVGDCGGDRARRVRIVAAVEPEIGLGRGARAHDVKEWT